MVSVDALTKLIDPNQILLEFGGCLYYDHVTWIDLRMVLNNLNLRQNNKLEILGYRKALLEIDGNS